MGHALPNFIYGVSHKTNEGCERVHLHEHAFGYHLIVHMSMGTAIAASLDRVRGSLARLDQKPAMELP